MMHATGRSPKSSTFMDFTLAPGRDYLPVVSREPAVFSGGLRRTGDSGVDHGHDFKRVRLDNHNFLVNHEITVFTPSGMDTDERICTSTKWTLRGTTVPT